MLLVLRLPRLSLDLLQVGTTAICSGWQPAWIFHTNDDLATNSRGPESDLWPAPISSWLAYTYLYFREGALRKCHLHICSDSEATTTYRLP
jgi:hypothetical protein